MSEMEFILPSGKFCKIRRITAGDLLLSMLQMAPEIPLVAVLYARVTTIDDVPITPTEYMNLDVQDHIHIPSGCRRLMGR